MKIHIIHQPSARTQLSNVANLSNSDDSISLPTLLLFFLVEYPACLLSIRSPTTYGN